ncbi:MAG: TolC family protein, partial [Bacteroidaceae bacterium]|nr:TolC family protein [Bacteroidaceae bacterium]
MMRLYKLSIVILLILFAQSAVAADSLVLSLEQTIRLAQEHSPSVQAARHTFLAAYWNYRQYRANYLPSVSLESSPSLNRSINKITQSDGTSVFLKQNQFNVDLSMKINQNIAFTGGNFFIKSTITRLDELELNTTSFSTQPLIVGYEQSLFGYNSLKWSRKTEPVRYRKACQTYAEAIELVSAQASNYFFRLMLAQANLDMARLNLASADTLFSMAKGRYSIGNINENEMLQLEINRLNEETNFMDAEINMEEELQSFRSFLGLDQNIIFSLVPPDSVPTFSISVTEALEKALENSPDPTYYQLLKIQSKSDLAYAKANAGLKADIYLQFGLSQTAHTMQESFRSPLHQEYVTVSVSLPLLDWGRGRGQVKVARSNLDLTETTIEQGM